MPIDSWVTCNRFGIKECEETWHEYVLLFRELLEVEGIFVVGFGSDGDARRANMQLAMMSKELNDDLRKANLLRYDDVHDMFEFAPAVRGYDTDKPDLAGVLPPENLHNQDPKHNLKKLFTLLFSSRMPVLGKHVATLNHVNDIVMKLYPSGMEGHGCRKNDGHPEDRQNVAAPSRVSGYRVRDYLRKIQDSGKEDVLGTLKLLDVLAAYQEMFLSTKVSLEDRLRKIGFVMNFLRLWSWAVQADTKLTLAENFYSQQTFRHVILSLHSATFLILTFRDHCPSSSIFQALRRTGSDICERYFSMAGGHGTMSSGRRNYRFWEFVDALKRHSTVETVMATNDAMRYTTANRKGEWCEAHHVRDPKAPDATVPATKAECVIFLMLGALCCATGASRLCVLVPAC